MRLFCLTLATFVAQITFGAPDWVEQYRTHPKIGQRLTHDTILLREIVYKPGQQSGISSRLVILNGGEGNFSDCIHHAAFSGKSAFNWQGAWIVSAEGRIRQAEKSALTVNNLWSETILYSDDYVATIRLDNEPVGSIVCIQYERSVDRELDFGLDYLQEKELAIDSTIIAFRVSPGYAVRFRPSNIQPSLVVALQSEFRAGKVDRWRGNFYDGGYDHAAARVEWTILRDSDTLHPPRSWQDVADEAAMKWAGVNSKLPANDYILSEMSSCAAGIQPILSKLENDFRYVAVEVGEGKIIPHEPADVLRYRYGDCKDLSFLIVNLLANASVKLTPVLVRMPSDEPFNPEYPSSVQFNHVITAVECEGDTVYYDPTARGHPFGQLPWADQGAYALWLRPGADLVQLPRDTVPMLYIRTISGVISLAGSLRGTYSITYDHRVSRNGTVYSKTAQVAELLGKQLADGIGLDVLDFHQDSLSLTANVEIRNLWKRVGDRVFWTVYPFTQPRDSVGLCGEDGYFLGRPTEVHSTLHLTLPELVQVSSLPSDSIVLNTGYSKLSSNSNDSVLTASWTRCIVREHFGKERKSELDSLFAAFKRHSSWMLKFPIQ